MTEPEEPEIRSDRLRLIAGLQSHFTAKTVGGIPALWQRLIPYFGNVASRVGDIDYGIVWHMDNPDGFDYLAGFEVARAKGLPEEFTCLTIPAQRYAVFPHRTHVLKIKETVGAIFQQWLPQSGYRVAEFPHIIERLGGNFNPKTGTGDIEVWVPLREQED